MSEAYPVQNPRVAWRVYDGEAVLVSPDDSRLHQLNPVGTVIWEAADGRTAVSAIVARVCAAFDVEGERAAHDVAAFVASLVAHDLLRVAETPEPSA